MKAAAATSARSTRRPKGEPPATTTTIPTPPPGSSAAWATRPCCIKSRSPSTTCTPRNGATSNANHTPYLAAAQRERQGPHGPLRIAGRERAYVVSGDARRAERGADHQGRRAGGVRPRLPRGHLRHVRLHGERGGARSAAGDHAVPTPHAPFQRRQIG